MVSNRVLNIMCEEMISELQDCIDVLNAEDCIGLDDKWNKRIMQAYEILCNNDD